MLPALYQHTHVPSVNTQTQSSSIIIDHHRSLMRISSHRTPRRTHPGTSYQTRHHAWWCSPFARRAREGRRWWRKRGRARTSVVDGACARMASRAYCSPSNAHRTRTRTRAPSSNPAIESRGIRSDVDGVGAIYVFERCNRVYIYICVILFMSHHAYRACIVNIWSTLVYSM